MMNFKKLRRIAALSLAMTMLFCSTAFAAAPETPEEDGANGARLVEYHTKNNAYFSGTFIRDLDGADGLRFTLNSTMNIGFYYDDGVYASICSYVYLSSSAQINGAPVECHFHNSSSQTHDGVICGVYGIAGYMYRAHLALDEWGQEYIKAFGRLYDFE